MEWIQTFLSYITTEKRFSKHTIKAYQPDLMQFTVVIENELSLESIKEVSFQGIRSWIFYLLENGDSPRSVNRKISTLKTFYKFLLRNGYIKSNPIDKIIAPKQSKRLPSFVDEGEMTTMFTKIEFPIRSKVSEIERF
jgi:integrase/recombinase XerC